MLTAHNLACTRGNHRLFNGIDLHLQQGQWLYLQGENGAGKTSLLRILAGLTPPLNGSVCWQGQPIRAQASAYRQQMLYLGHHGSLKDDLTLVENLHGLLAMDGVPRSNAAIREALARMGLARRLHLPARVLSAGQKRRGLLARLLLRPTRLWLLDEPFTALDTAAVIQLQDGLNTHLAEGGLLVLTSHQPPDLAIDSTTDSTAGRTTGTGAGFSLNLSAALPHQVATS